MPISIFIFVLLFNQTLVSKAEDPNNSNNRKETVNNNAQKVQNLPPDKQKLYQKYAEHVAKGFHLIKNDKPFKPPFKDVSNYEILVSLSQEMQRFYVQEVILSEDHKKIGIFSAEIILDEKEDWKIAKPITRWIVDLDDLKDPAKNQTFRYSSIEGAGKFIEPSKPWVIEDYSRFMQDVLKEEAERKEAQEKVLIKIRDKNKSATNPQ